MSLFDDPFSSLVWYLLVGTRGAQSRILIIKTLQKRPMNRNQLAKELNLDYKTIEHHLKLLCDNMLLSVINKGSYGEVYIISPQLKNTNDTLKEIMDKFGNNLGENSEQVYKQNKKIKNKR